MGGAWVHLLMLILTAGVAAYGLTFRDAFGERPWVHLLIGGIAAVFFLRTLLGDVLALEL